MEFLIAGIILLLGVFVIAKHDDNQNVLNIIKTFVKALGCLGCLAGLGCMIVISILIVLIIAGITLGFSLV